MSRSDKIIREIYRMCLCKKHSSFINAITVEIDSNAIVVAALIISRRRRREQLRARKRWKERGDERKSSPFSPFRCFRGSLILSDASFQRRVNDPLVPISFSLPSSSFSLAASARGAFLVKISEFLRRGFCNRERRESTSSSSSSS